MLFIGRVAIAMASVLSVTLALLLIVCLSKIQKHIQWALIIFYLHVLLGHLPSALPEWVKLMLALYWARSFHCPIHNKHHYYLQRAPFLIYLLTYYELVLRGMFYALQILFLLKKPGKGPWHTSCLVSS